MHCLRHDDHYMASLPDIVAMGTPCISSFCISSLWVFPSCRNTSLHKVNYLQFFCYVTKISVSKYKRREGKTLETMTLWATFGNS